MTTSTKYRNGKNLWSRWLTRRANNFLYSRNAIATRFPVCGKPSRRGLYRFDQLALHIESPSLHFLEIV
ncbi:MAG: hypothetical protein ACLFTJ_07710 [Halothece sp.]